MPSDAEAILRDSPGADSVETVAALPPVTPVATKRTCRSAESCFCCSGFCDSCDCVVADCTDCTSSSGIPPFCRIFDCFSSCDNSNCEESNEYALRYLSLQHSVRDKGYHCLDSRSRRLRLSGDMLDMIGRWSQICFELGEI